jgi:hypothetical protein
MKIYDTNYGPDTFGRIRMGLITEMFLTFEGYLKPEVGDHLRISCLFKGVVQDVYTVEISEVCDCENEPQTVLIRIKETFFKNKMSGFEFGINPILH